MYVMNHLSTLLYGSVRLCIVRCSLSVVKSMGRQNLPLDGVSFPSRGERLEEQNSSDIVFRQPGRWAPEPESCSWRSADRQEEFTHELFHDCCKSVNLGFQEASTKPSTPYVRIAVVPVVAVGHVHDCTTTGG